MKALTSRTHKELKEIYLTNNVSATLIIPIEMARRNGLDQPSHVTIEEVDGGIMIRKADLTKLGVG